MINYVTKKIASTEYLLQNIPANCVWTDCTEWFDKRNDFKFCIPDSVKDYANTATTILIDLSEGYGTANFINDIQTIDVQNFLVLHTDMFYTGDTRTLFFPTDFILRSIDWDQRPISRNNLWLISCLNGRIDEHRIYNFLKLVTKPYYSQCLVSFRKSRIKSFLQNINNELLNQLYTDTTSVIKHLDTHERYITQDVTVNHPAYNAAYANLCTESLKDKPYLTEKSCKSLSTGQFMFMVGPARTMETIKSMGFDIFDDIFNHSYYDLESDWNQRIDKLHHVLDQHIYQLPELHNQLINRLEKNQNYFFSNDFRSKWFNNLNSKLIDK